MRNKLSEQHRRRISLAMKGRKLSHETIANMSESRKGKHYSISTEFIKGQVAPTKGRKFPERCGENHPNWKGDKIGYHGLHAWVRKEKGNPNICEQCGSNKNVQWANIGHKYKRNLSDWKSLCKSCHMVVDGFIGRKLSKQHKLKIANGCRKYEGCYVCGNKHFSGGLCVKHYKRLRRGTLDGVEYKAIIQ